MNQSVPDIDSIRAQFPALTSPTVFLDNAGGSQLPACVIEAAGEYLRNSFVQGGADYELSKNVTATIAAARSLVSTFLNAGSLGHVLLGSSTTALLHTVANAYAMAHARGDLPKQRNQLIVSIAGHEANIGPWSNLAERGFDIVWWKPVLDSAGDMTHNIASLAPLLTPRTLMVMFPQVSNIFGDIWDAAPLCKLAREHGALSVVDGVAFAPHQLPDVAAIGCDWYVYSTYKVFGPHMGALFGTHAAFAPLTGPNHYFIDRAAVPQKFELGGASHEGCAMIAGGGRYYEFLSGARATAGTAYVAPSRQTLRAAFARVEALETPLQALLIEQLLTIPGLRLLGPARADSSRVSTVSFTVEGRRSRELALALNDKSFGCRHGHFYSKRLLEHIGIADPADGVVRISLSHYNTAGEVERVVAALKHACNTAV